LKAVAPFTKNNFVEIRNSTADKAEIIFTAKTESQDEETLRGEFLNELLDQTLREQVARETELVRNLILAHALSKIDLIGTSSPPSSDVGE
jgi:His-Xaa-Ser system protein HxsD